jgi:hypothetical protein
MLRYRAILTDPGNAAAERPVQIFSNSRVGEMGVDAWAEKVLQSAVAADAFVDVYQNIEQRVAIIRKPKKEEPKA